MYVYLSIYTLDFSFYVGSIYNIVATKQENEEENVNTSSAGSFSSPEIFVSRPRH